MPIPEPSTGYTPPAPPKPTETRSAPSAPSAPAAPSAPSFPAPPTYPTTPLPLTGDQFAEFAARRRSASRQLEQAMARREAGVAEVDLLFQQLTNRLGREAGRREVDLRTQLADRGVAFQPRFMGKGLRDLRDWQAEESASMELDKAQRLSALEEMVRSAQETRELEHLNIDADEARRRSELERLLTSLGG